MRIGVAIRILTIHNDHNPDFTDAEREEAHQLGIEALKRHRVRYVLTYSGLLLLLPGETGKPDLATKKELYDLKTMREASQK